MTAEREGLAEEIARVLGEHRLRVTTADGCFCLCDAFSVGRGPGASTAHDTHLADALADLLAARDRRVRGEAAVDFAQWVATSRAHNGSDHQYGQSLYNECINAALPTWAVEWAEADA